MIRREWIGRMGAGAAGLAAIAGSSARAQHQEPAGGNIHEECADSCVNCEKECNQGFHHCYQQVRAGKVEHAKAMHLLADCGDICGTSGKLVARMSPLMVHTCGACGACCKDTIAAVEALNDDAMAETLDALRKCQESCESMVKAMGGHDHAAHDHDGH